MAPEKVALEAPLVHQWVLRSWWAPEWLVLVMVVLGQRLVRQWELPSWGEAEWLVLVMVALVEL